MPAMKLVTTGVYLVEPNLVVAGNPDGGQLLGAYFGLFDQMAEDLGVDFMDFVRERQKYWSGR